MRPRGLTSAHRHMQDDEEKDSDPARGLCRARPLLSPQDYGPEPIAMLARAPILREGAIAGKWLELLKEIAPRVKRSPCSIRQRQHRPNVPESRASRVSETVPPSGRESLRKPVRRSASLGSAPAQ
jgi:hypothetical protein